MAGGFCTVCGDYSEHLSRRGKCPDCGLIMRAEAARSISNKEGLAYDKWAAGMKAAGRRRPKP